MLDMPSEPLNPPLMLEPRRTRDMISDRASCDVTELLLPRREVGRDCCVSPPRVVIAKKGSGAPGDLRGLGAGVG